jgi:hypothetical protein
MISVLFRTNFLNNLRMDRHEFGDHILHTVTLPSEKSLNKLETSFPNIRRFDTSDLFLSELTRIEVLSAPLPMFGG